MTKKFTMININNSQRPKNIFNFFRQQTLIMSLTEHNTIKIYEKNKNLEKIYIEKINKSSFKNPRKRLSLCLYIHTKTNIKLE